MSISEKLKQIAENEQKVFEAGANVGGAAGYEEGKQSQYDEFWDSYQLCGERTDYAYAFYGEGWNNTTLHPKYKKITAFAATYMFRYSLYYGDITDILDIDFSECISLQYCFNGSLFTRIGVIDARGIASLGRTFQYAEYLRTIDKIILSDDNETSFTLAFDGCYELENIQFEGRICTKIDFGECEKLTKESILSVIKALHTEYTETLTLSETAVNNIDWTGTVIDGVTYSSFDEIIDTKPGWTISLV